MNSADASPIITVSIGDDLVLAQALAASLAGEGIETELVLSSDPYVGLEHTSPHRLMIREADIELARPIIEAHLEVVSAEETPAVRRRGARDIVALVLLISFAGGWLVGLTMAAWQFLQLVLPS